VMWEKRIISGKVLKQNKGGLIVQLSDRDNAFVKYTLVSALEYKNYDFLMGNKIDLIIKGIDYLSYNEGSINIYASAREACRIKNFENSNNIKKKLESGEVVQGFVQKIMKNRIFIDFYNFQGSIPFSDWENKLGGIHPARILIVGDKIDVNKVSFNEDLQQWVLSHTQTFEKKKNINSYFLKYRETDKMIDVLRNNENTWAHKKTEIQKWLKHGGNSNVINKYFESIIRKQILIPIEFQMIIYETSKFFISSELEVITEYFVRTHQNLPFECYKTLATVFMREMNKEIILKIISKSIKIKSWQEYLIWTFTQPKYDKKLRDQIKKWIDTGNDIDIIRDIIVSYLDEYSKEKSSFGLLIAWMNTTKSVIPIEQYVLSFLENNSTDHADKVRETYLGLKNGIT
ncbi:MAG: hypothetical protein WBA74_27905, partial [Cyclobacteriaceae bacterium]